ncbi:MAG: ATP-binding cassette domain-containing protein [Bacillota bacterium]
MTINIKAENLSVTYKKMKALTSISFSIEKEGIYGLVGRNGAGKTTLLSLLASFMGPSSGTITMDGEDPFENARIMQHVSFIFESDYKEDDHKAIEFLEFQARYRPAFDMDYAKELARKFKLPLDKAVKKLSDGKQSTLNVIIGLASRSKLTIFDEAYRGMDAPTREVFYKEVLEEQERHPRIMILSTHLVSEMEYLFDHVLILDKGKLIVNETYDDLISRGFAVTGDASAVDVFVTGMKPLHTKQLGNTKSVMLFGELSGDQLHGAERAGLEIGPVTLQELFIHLTEEEDHDEN